MVDVIRLRADGVKLSPEAVKATPPIRGDLRMGSTLQTGSVGGWEPGRVYHAELKAGPNAKGHSQIPDLRDAFVKKIEGDSLLVVGYELIGGFSKAHARVQTWWCKVVTA
jgi:hypothetical protein